MSDRVSPFGDLKDFEPAPSKKPVSKLVEMAAIDQVAADNGFPSRQAPKPEPEAAPRQRRYTTGRNQQINVKATTETIALFYQLADKMHVPLGEVLARALDALSKDTK
jgi:hypothetical protein